MHKRAYVNAAKTAILDLLSVEHAAVRDEIEAKIADRQYPTAPSPIDPHHITTALRELTSEGIITSTAAQTKGSRTISTIHMANTTDIGRRIEDAAARKRLLHGRWLSWSVPSSRYPRGRIGPAGEAVFHLSLIEAARYGFNPLRPEGGEVSLLFGEEVPGGALDNAAVLQRIDPATNTPSAPVTLVIEVKNRRGWIYPRHAELHQVLYKAAGIQRRHLDQLVLPILVCRKRHYSTYTMAQDLGFFVIATFEQPVLPSDIEERQFAEVHTELAYDVRLGIDAASNVVEALTGKLTRNAADLARTWRLLGHSFEGYYKQLRRSELPDGERRRIVDAMRATARNMGCEGLWAMSDD